MAAALKDILTELKRRGLHPKGKAPDGLAVERVTEISGECDAGSLFVAIEGTRADGHAWLADAAGRGAAAALVDRKKGIEAPAGMTLIAVDDTRRAAGPAAQIAAGNPARRLDVFGVTGTNGKTTTVWLMEAILKAAGRRPGLISTIVNRWGDHEFAPNETTPSGPALADRMKAMVEAGMDSVAMEVSSHAIDQHRVDGVPFRAIALTNVSQDHLDYHHTMEAYAAVKTAIFKRMREENADAIGVINLDDPTGVEIARLLRPEHRLTYAIRAPAADLQAESILFRDEGIRLNLSFRGRKFSVDSPMPCYFNAMNCMTATALALAGGIEIDRIIEGCAGFPGAPGRFEILEGRPGVTVIVDYAHTPDALTQALLNARSFARRRLLAVIGCGGDRDRDKRPLMGKAAAALAHEVIITNDNPRSEDPERIAAEIVGGLGEEGPGRPPHRVILDRRSAIRFAIESAMEGDAVIIAGKGHEDYQILGSGKIHFDDREIAREIIDELSARAHSTTQGIAMTGGAT